MLALAERITGGEARDLAEVLPPEVAPPLVPPEDVAEKFDLAEFLRRVSERADVDETLARRGAGDVHDTEAGCAGQGVRDVLDQLPKEFQDI